MLALIGKQQVLILVDSGSIGTFVSDRLVQKLNLKTVEATVLTFSIADGSTMHCNSVVPELIWFLQGHSFTSTAKVLPLRCFDIILGEDCLEEVSLVWVHYRT